jgi:hypothetical protein
MDLDEVSLKRASGTLSSGDLSGCYSMTPQGLKTAQDLLVLTREPEPAGAWIPDAFIVSRNGDILGRICFRDPVQ